MSNRSPLLSLLLVIVIVVGIVRHTTAQTELVPLTGLPGPANRMTYSSTFERLYAGGNCYIYQLSVQPGNHSVTTWTPLITVTGNFVSSIVQLDNSMYFGGDFSYNNVPSHLLILTSSGRIGTVADVPGPIRTMVAVSAGLYVIQQMNTTTSQFLVHFFNATAEEWTRDTIPTAGIVNAIAVFSGSLYAGGFQIEASGASHSLVRFNLNSSGSVGAISAVNTSSGVVWQLLVDSTGLYIGRHSSNGPIVMRLLSSTAPVETLFPSGGTALDLAVARGNGSPANLIAVGRVSSPPSFTSVGIYNTSSGSGSSTDWSNIGDSGANMMYAVEFVFPYIYLSGNVTTIAGTSFSSGSIRWLPPQFAGLAPPPTRPPSPTPSPITFTPPATSPGSRTPAPTTSSASSTTPPTTGGGPSTSPTSEPSTTTTPTGDAQTQGNLDSTPESATGMIIYIGVSIAVLLLIAIIIVVIVVMRRRRKENERNQLYAVTKPHTNTNAASNSVSLESRTPESTNKVTYANAQVPTSSAVTNSTTTDKLVYANSGPVRASMQINQESDKTVYVNANSAERTVYANAAQMSTDRNSAVYANAQQAATNARPSSVYANANLL